MPREVCRPRDDKAPVLAPQFAREGGLCRTTDTLDETARRSRAGYLRRKAPPRWAVVGEELHDVLDPAYPRDDLRRSAMLPWDLDDAANRDLLHRLVGLLAEADCAVAERFLRHLVLTAPKEPGSPVILVAGPLAAGPLDRLADEIAKLPDVLLRHRLIRGGFCRMDGWSQDVETLCGRLVLVPGVAEVRRISDTIYVLTYPESEPAASPLD